ncbi:peptidyl-prolyl cis-trans isomerase [Bacillus benzoevorans]|uniref:Peptidyl-prolyl cis-trans isomerase n=1 Tax=Bacillus benzoevorans TaxID=1456 RepID=A0A7X0HQ33_9BACI|nr:peptidyl-prolyl cis-trans isomerase [Bacillus benzoevorans]MBB6443702.1 hypothetical protein [Bacillus benzoevorans]
MEKIITVHGKVRFPITIDPSVWIFDDRKIDLDIYFEQHKGDIDTLEDYTRNISKHWDQEILEGAAPPDTEPTRKKYLKEILLTGTFGMPFKPFLQNAEPLEEAKQVIIVTSEEETAVPIAQAQEMILKFSQNGKPLTEDGPVHLLFNDGSNKQDPIKHVTGFRLES